MFGRFNLGLIITLASGILLSSSVPAQRVDPFLQDKCARYAQRAVEQFKIMNSSAQCRVTPDPRWQDNYGNHFGACMVSPPAAMQAEQRARDNHLLACGAGLHLIQ